MPRKRRARLIAVRPLPGAGRRGTLRIGHLAMACALGRGGLTRRKREGDGATPAGRLALLAVLYRADRVRRPQSALPARPIRPDDGWCDDPADANYNRPVRLPYPASHERLWRADRLYDVLVVLDWNLEARRPRGGSAIFLHVAAPGLTPTAGCVALAPGDMRRLLPLVGRGTAMRIG